MCCIEFRIHLSLLVLIHFNPLSIFCNVLSLIRFFASAIFHMGAIKICVRNKRTFFDQLSRQYIFIQSCAPLYLLVKQISKAYFNILRHFSFSQICYSKVDNCAVDEVPPFLTTQICVSFIFFI